MTRSMFLPCALIAIGLAASGCSTQRTVEVTEPSESMSMEGIRTPDDPILGAVSAEGACDPEVLSVEDNVLVYRGQPGDEIEVSITGTGDTPRMETFTMGSTDTEHRLDLGDWESLGVQASGRVGLPGECVLSK
ncbi:hypothetical protein [Corynebacterium oculi]|uniref:Lipoprotein n=1 Tax=Corynebacterium oculi TaxID=1544416 RepID=A0A0Q1DT55_9CORY|nr:hypothetical protein [Corynebacterium oculi]KQB83243.1 hypothetical protein Cocul_02217 [Corynebacterium oculi]